MSDNFAAADLTLDDEDMVAIDALDRQERMGEDARAM
jgi:2,5-diketo-D-gluconate reductase A